MPLAMTGYEIGLLSTALAFIAFALVVSLVIPRSRPTFPTPYLGIFVGVCALFFVAQMSAVVLLAEVGEEHEEVAHETEPGDTEPSPAVPPPTETEPTGTEPPGGSEAAGREIFATEGCATCHTLADANATGAVGPNLDESMPTVELAVDRVTNGAGAMPPFEGELSPEQIQSVAEYVSSVAGS